MAGVRTVKRRPGEPSRACAVVPAWNEAGRVGATVAALLSIPAVGTVVVVDDGSSDGTGTEAANAGAYVVRHHRRRGKGAALRTGVAAVEGDPLCFADADLGDSARALGPLVEAVAAGVLDMAVAVLPPSGAGGGFGLTVNLARYGVRCLTGCSLQAPLSGQRVLRRDLFETLGCPPGFAAEVYLTAAALRAGYRVGEMMLPLRHRVTGWDAAAILHRAHQFAAVVRGLALAARVPRTTVRPSPAAGTLPDRASPEASRR
ncbi:MAG: glycosyltransferase [Clostridia bacterium]|nr:glycosyltransferase [Clostridia bacterium]